MTEHAQQAEMLASKRSLSSTNGCWAPASAAGTAGNSCWRLGVRPRLEENALVVAPDQERRIRADLGGHIPKLEDGPWPAFPADLMSIAIVVASTAKPISSAASIDA